jgi:hypothetical protein
MIDTSTSSISTSALPIGTSSVAPASMSAFCSLAAPLYLLEPPLPAEKAHTFRASASTPTRFESNAPPSGGGCFLSERRNFLAVSLGLPSDSTSITKRITSASVAAFQS